MDDLRALLDAFQKNMDDAFQRVLDDMHRQSNSYKQVNAAYSEIQIDSTIFQENLQECVDNSFLPPPSFMIAPPMMHKDQEQIWNNGPNAAVDSWSLITKQSEREQLVQEPLIQEKRGSVSYNEYTPREPPPELPSMRLKGQIIFNMPLMSTGMEIVILELMHPQWIDPKQPLGLYIDSPGTTYEEFATAEAARIKQRISIILVFDPGGISFI